MKPDKPAVKAQINGALMLAYRSGQPCKLVLRSGHVIPLAEVTSVDSTVQGVVAGERLLATLDTEEIAVVYA